MNNTYPFYTVFQVLKVLLTKICKMQPPDLLFLYSGHWGINPPFKNTTPFLTWLNKLSKPPILGNPLYILVLQDPLKVGSFSEPQKYQHFSSLIPFYLLKVTKFLGKISQFELLVMTEKNIFAYKLFLSLNISDFNLFLCENCNPFLKKKHPLFPSSPLQKLRSCQAPSFWKFGWRVNRPPPCRKGGGCAHTMFLFYISFYISISTNHFSKIFRTSFNIIWKKIFITNFYFLTDSLQLPPL